MHYNGRMTQKLTSRQVRQARQVANLARPVRELAVATDIDKIFVRVGDTVEFAPGRTTVVTRIYQEPTAERAYEAPVAEVTNAVISVVVVSQVKKVAP